MYRFDENGVDHVPWMEVLNIETGNESGLQSKTYLCEDFLPIDSRFSLRLIDGAFDGMDAKYDENRVKKANDDICAPFRTNGNTVVDGTNDMVQVVQDLMTWYLVVSEMQVRL